MVFMRNKNIFALILALMLLVICSLSVSASADALPGEVPAQSDIANPVDETGVSVIEDSAAGRPVVLEGSEVQDGGGEQETGEDIAPLEEEQPPASKNTNTPYFIGAGIAVLLFIGVALYCRANGNR